MSQDTTVTTERGAAMSTLYENEHQVQSVISRYHREAREANQLASGNGREADVVERTTGNVLQAFRRFVHGLRPSILDHSHAGTFLHVHR